MFRKAQSPKSLRADARAALQSCAGWNARLAARRLTQFLEQHMDGAGLSFAQFGLMATLEAEGLVEIAIAEDDQRRRLVWLTEKGARRLEAALVSWRQAHVELGKRVSADLARRLALETELL